MGELGRDWARGVGTFGEVFVGERSLLGSPEQQHWPQPRPARHPCSLPPPPMFYLGTPCVLMEWDLRVGKNERDGLLRPLLTPTHAACCRGISCGAAPSTALRHGANLSLRCIVPRSRRHDRGCWCWIQRRPAAR
jgi:hypothetical protein